jgi:hypothetical protein
VTALLPEVVREAIEGQSLQSASESFGLVTLVLLVALLLEYEVLRTARPARARMITLSAVIGPLSVVVLITIVARIAAVVP